jgi:hypothetical protein
MEVTTSVSGVSRINSEAFKLRIREAQDQAGQKMAEDVRGRASGLFGSGPYSEGWVSEREYSEVVVRNTGRDKSLAHLLEFGHAVKNQHGGPFGYWTPPAPHLTPAYETAKTQYMLKLSEAAQTGVTME